MPLTYAELSDIHDSLGLSDDLPAWAAKMNEQTGTTNYSAGLKDSWLRRRSRNLDQLLEATGLPSVLGDVGAGVGGLLGASDEGRSIGHGLLRTAIDFAPMTFATGGLGLAGSALLSGIRGYGDTGNVSSGLIGAATTAALPVVGNMAGQAFLRGVGAPLLEGEIKSGVDAAGNAILNRISTRLPQNISQGIGSFAANTLAAGGVGEVSDAVDAAFDPDREYQFNPAKAFLGMTLGQLPFAGHLLGRKGAKMFGGAATREHEAALKSLFAEGAKIVEKKQAVLNASKTQPIEEIPKVALPPEPNLKDLAEMDAINKKILGQIEENNSAPTESGAKDNEDLTRAYEDNWASHGELLATKPLELPVTNPEEKPAFSEPEKQLHEASAAVDTAKTLPEFHLAVGALNQVRKQMGLPLLTQERINTIATNRKLSQTAATKAVVNKTQRLAEALKEPQTEQETQRIKDQENQLRARIGSGSDVAATAGENRGTAGGVPIVPLPKLSEITRPVHDLVDETIIHPLAKQAESDFNQWKSKTADPASFGEEVERYKIYEQLRNDGDIGVQTKLTPDEQEVLNDAFGDEGLRVADPKLLADFPARPHILTLDRVVQQKLAQKIQQNSSPGPLQPSRPNLPAGSNFVWGLEDYNPATNKIGKHTLPKTGLLKVSQFKNMGGRGKPLSDAEIELGKQFVPDAFDKDGNVDVRKLYQGLKEKGPVVEVKKLGESVNTNKLQQIYDQVAHELDTQFPGWNQRTSREATGPERSLRSELSELESQMSMRQDVSASRYSFLGPKPESAMPGYVEGLVRVPLNTKVKPSEHPLVGNKGAQEIGLKFNGPHFGSEDTNVLAFFRGYEETLPDGRKAFHVIEVQSDWGQEQRKLKENQDHWRAQGDEGMARRGTEALEKGGHPLLSAYELLALKAAIAHAKSIGADSIMLSDGETAMMTEGHDKVAEDLTIKDGFKSIDDADEWIKKQPDNSDLGYTRESDGTWSVVSKTKKAIKQSAGMRLHYDTTLPSAMAKLTGDKGERVEVGVHKQSMDNQESSTELDYFANNPQALAMRRGQGFRFGSPVFKNEQGEPKSSITGRIYDLSKISFTSDQQGGLTLTDPSRAPEPEPFVPADTDTAKTISQMDLARGGQGLADFVASNSNISEYRDLAQFLATNYPEQLKRTSTVVNSPFSGSNAGLHPHTREGNIAIDAGLLSAPKELLNRTALHELIHQVSQGELDNPTKLGIREKLEELLDRVRKSLPADQKASLDKALSDDWLGKWSRGETQEDTLHPDHKIRTLLYGLLNVKEFVAEGLLSRSPLQTYLQSQKGKSQGFWSKLKDGIKGLLGLKTTTALDEFLDHSDALLSRGEHVANFYNFGERYFEGLGNNRSLAQSQTLRAASVLHMANEGDIGKRDIIDFLNQPVYSDVAGQQVAKFRATPGETRAKLNLERSLQNTDEDAQHLALNAKELGFEPTRQGVEEYLGEALNGTSVTQGGIISLPEVAARYMFERAKSMKNVLEGLGAAADKQNEGFLNLANPAAVHKPVADALRAINNVLAYEKDFDLGADVINGLSATTPNGFLTKTIAAAPKWSDRSPAPTPLVNFIDPTETQPRRKGFAASFGQFFKHNFMLQNQSQDPTTLQLFTKGKQLAADAHKMEREATKMYAVNFDDGTMNKDNVKLIEKDMQYSPIMKAANKWIYVNQNRNKDAVTLIKKEDPEVAKVLAGLTPDQVRKAEDMVYRHGLANVQFNKQELAQMGNTIVTESAGLLNGLNQQKHATNLVLTQTLWDALNANKQDPMAMAKVQTDLAAIQSRMAPDQFNSLYKFMSNEFDKYSAWQKYFAENPNWSSAKRVGPYIVEFKRPDGKIETQGTYSKKDADQLVEDAKGKLISFRPSAKPGDEELPTFGTDRQQLSDYLNEKMKSGSDILRQLGWSEGDIALRERLSESNAFARGVNATGLRDPNADPRYLNRGAENVPYISNQFSWFKSRSRYWTRRLYRAQADALIRQQELTPELKTDLTTQRDNQLQPDPEVVKKINNVVRTWYLGGNMATAMMNMFQAFQTHVTELTNMTGEVFGSYKRIAKTAGEMVRQGFDKTWADPELTRLEKDATESGEISAGKFDDDAAFNEATTNNFIRAANSNRAKTMGQQVGTIFGSLSRASMAAFRHTESFNNRLAIITAFKLFREQGQSYEQARDNAFLYNSRVNFTGAKAARPLGMGFQSNSPTIRGAAMLASVMQSYMLGSMGQLARFVKRGFFDGSRLTPAERYAARKATVQALGAQVAAAGLLGLPFVSSILSLIDKAFPDAEVNKKLRETVHTLFTQDDENGGVLSDIAMTGLPSMLGWDMQSRLSMGNNLPGVSELNGFQPEAMLGPATNMIKDFVAGSRGALTGDQSAKSLVPPALRKLQQLISNDGNIRDYRDRPIIDNLTAGEKLGAALGFNPKRLSDFNAANRMADLSEHNVRHENNQQNQQLAEEAMRGNFGSVRQTLLQRAATDKSFDAAGAAEDIARVAEELTFPRDLRREGYDPNKAKVLSYFNLTQAPPSEITRLQFRTQIQQSLGLPTPPSSSEVQLAQLIDALRVKSPGASRSELRRTAELLLRRTSREQILAQ